MLRTGPSPSLAFRSPDPAVDEDPRDSADLMVYNSLDMEESSFSPPSPVMATLHDPFEDPLEEVFEALFVDGLAMMSPEKQTNEGEKNMT